MVRAGRAALLALDLGWPRAAAATTASGGGGRRRRRRRPEGRQADRPERRRLRVPRPGRVVLPVRLHGPLRDDAAAVLVQARPGDAAADARPGQRPVEDLGRRQAHHGRDQEGRQVRPARRPRGQGRRRRVRARARLHRERRQRLRDDLPGRRRSACPRSSATTRTSRASRRSTTTRSRSTWTSRRRASPRASLVLPASAPVPREYAEKYDTKSPSEYAQHQIASGPVHDRERRRGQGDRLGPGPPHPPGAQPELGREDRLPARLRRRDRDPRGQRPRRGEPQDPARQGHGHRRHHRPGEVVKEASQRYKDQLELPLSGGYRYVAFDTTKPPFDDPNVRKATIAGMDRAALRQARGGPAIGDVATHFIPPDFPGFEESGGKAGTGVDFLRARPGTPRCRPSTSRPPGFAGGKYEGKDKKISLVCDDDDPGKKVCLVADQQLSELGFDTADRLRPARRRARQVLRRPEEPAQRLPERRVGEGLLRPADAARLDVQPGGDPAGEQLELPAARRPEAREGSSRRLDADRARRARPGVRRDQQDDHRAGAGRSLRVGQAGERPVAGRERRDQRVERPLGPDVHSSDVGSNPSRQRRRSRRCSPT